MDKFRSVVKEIESKFPDFEIDEDMIDLPTVIFGDLCDYLIDKLLKDDSETINKFVDFVEKLSDDLDPNISAGLDEIYLGLYTTKLIDYKKFQLQLSFSAKNRFQKSIDLWAAGNKSTKK